MFATLRTISLFRKASRASLLHSFALTRTATTSFPSLTLTVARALGNELLKEQFALTPVFLIYTILSADPFYFALNESSLFQFSQMLRTGSFGYWKHLVHLAKEALILHGKKLHDGNPRGIAESLGITGQPFLLVCIFVL